MLSSKNVTLPLTPLYSLSHPPHFVTSQTCKLLTLEHCTNIAYFSAHCLHFGANLFAKKKHNKRKQQIDARVKLQTNVDGVNSFRLYVSMCVPVLTKNSAEIVPFQFSSHFKSCNFAFFIKTNFFAVIWRRQAMCATHD